MSFQKKHSIEIKCDEGEGTLEVSNNQLGQMLIASMDFAGVSDIKDQYFSVKVTGEGLQTKYFINKLKV